MAEQIVIDGEVLSAQIVALQAVRAQSPAAPSVELSSLGPSARVAALLPLDFFACEVALDALIDQTVAFLQNVQDTFVDVDEAAAEAAVRLVEAVS
jgi:hypothetical protein